jgi:hypothetical protein
VNNTTYCAKCGKRMTVMIISDNGRTDFVCISCDSQNGRPEDVNLPVVDTTALSLVPGYKQ